MELKIGKSQNIWDNLPDFKPPPITDLACLHGKRPAHSEVVVMMRQDALLQIDLHGRSDTSVELGGLLLGNVYQHDDRLFVEVGGAIQARSDQNGPVHFTFTADAWAAAHKERETLYPDLKIIGWFHTHPDLGVFYSGDDVVVHTTAFNLPWHIGLVLDPVRDTVALFGWAKDTNEAAPILAPIQGWYEMSDTQDGSIVPWRFRHQHGLSGMRRDAMRSNFSRFDNGYAGQTAEYSEPLPLVTNGELTAIAMFLALIALIFTFLVYYPSVENNQKMAEVTVQFGQAQVNSWDENKAVYCSTQGLFILDPAPMEQLAVGDLVIIVGQAEIAGIRNYDLQVRRPETSWQTFAQVTSDGVGPLAKWSTRDISAGEYHLRLIARNGLGELLPKSFCQTSVQLVDPISESSGEN
ncbi:MAG: proteasome lid subunit RPN8/RPN11 [Cellvibrionaceae bacterium]|jgi:proteasome lid subunit RPN8/RPN11